MLNVFTSKDFVRARYFKCIWGLFIFRYINVLIIIIIIGQPTISGKIGRIAFEEPDLQLIKGKCLPIILYGLETCPLKKPTSDHWTLSSIVFLWNYLGLTTFILSDVVSNF